MTRIIPSSVDFSDRDFESLKLRLQGLARSVFPDWTDFNTANFGNILLELFCYVGDTLHFYQDNQAGETFTPTLNQRISMIRLGQLINFTLSGAAAATVTCRFSIPVANPTATLPIARGTRLRTTDPELPQPCQTLAYDEIPPGSTFVDIPVEQSEARSETFYSTGEPNQELVLTYKPFLDGSVDSVVRDGATVIAGVTAANGDYVRADSFLGYGPTDRVFVVLVDHLDKCHIRFGNGATGAIPQGEITTAYRIGGGIAGNVEAGRITVIEDTLAFDDGSAATVTVTNLAAASGGADRMTLAEARVLAPASLRTLTRSVSKEDFETSARSVRGVARALMATSNEYAGIPENTGELYIVAQGSKLASGRIAPATPSSTLLQEVASYINTNRPPTVTFTYSTLAAPFKNVTVAARVYLKRGFTGATVAAAIRAALADFFAVQDEEGADNTDIDFGANLASLDVNWLTTYNAFSTSAPQGEVAWSDVFNAVRDVSGVRKVDEGQNGLLLNGVRRSVDLLPIEFPKLLAVTLTDADTEQAL